MEFTIIAVAAAFALVFAIGLSFLSFKYCRENREKLEILAEQSSETEKTLENCKRELEQATEQNADFARRIAWLETRQRQAKTAPETVEPEPQTASNGSPKQTMSERRHRVLKLAAKGQNAETIAATLGMLAGEVELILNLDKASA